MADAHAAARRSEEELTHIVLDFSGSSGLDLTTMLSLQYLVTEAAKLKVGRVGSKLGRVARQGRAGRGPTSSVNNPQPTLFT